MRTNFADEQSGQALIEMAAVTMLLCVIVLGIVDFGRAIYDVEVMKNLAGEGSSMASRGTSAQLSAQTVVTEAGSDINLSSQGCVVETVVTNQSGTLSITDQQSSCGSSSSYRSKIGCLQGVGGCQSSSPALPSYASTALSAEVSGSSIYVTEVYHSFSPITPVVNILGPATIPNQFYAVAYY
jgi:Flp pilus assembly protein TadG